MYVLCTCTCPCTSFHSLGTLQPALTQWMHTRFKANNWWCHNRKSTWSSGAFSAATHLCVVLVLVHVQASTRVFEIILGSPSQTRRNLCVLGREAEYADRGRFPNHHIQRHVYWFGRLFAPNNSATRLEFIALACGNLERLKSILCRYLDWFEGKFVEVVLYKL